jgi:hypothetical protein
VQRGGCLAWWCRVGFGKGWWSASFDDLGAGSWVAALGCSGCAPSGEILAPAWLELAMVTVVAITYFLGSIVVRCAHSCACGLDSGGKPQIRDRAMEARLCVVLVGGIVSESPAARVWGKMVVVGLLCEVQVCSLAKRMTRAEDGLRRDFVSRFYPVCPMSSSAKPCCCGIRAAVASLRRR